jgi:hypothetical protein
VVTASTLPACPKCGAEMLRKPVRKGPRAGLEMWGCQRWPQCDGAINIDPVTDTPGAYAQRQLERERALRQLKRRALLPLWVGAGVLLMAIMFFALQGLGTGIASLGAVVVGVFFALSIFRLPLESVVWTKALDGERRTAAYLEPLLTQGFVVLHNRQIPGRSADVDHICIGPTGVFVIETKNWGGRLSVTFGQLSVGDHDRTWVLDQIYREAVAVQIALGDVLNERRVTVTPILCAVGGVAKLGARSVGGVTITDGRNLARLLLDRPRVLDDDDVQLMARVADERLRPTYAWEHG